MAALSHWFWICVAAIVAFLGWIVFTSGSGGFYAFGALLIVVWTATAIGAAVDVKHRGGAGEKVGILVLLLWPVGLSMWSSRRKRAPSA